MSEKKLHTTTGKRPVRRRRPKGVPGGVVAVVTVVALFLGGLAGYVIANNTNHYRTELEAANAEITRLTNTLSLAGYTETQEGTEQWIFDDSDLTDEFGDLSGNFGGDNTDALWTDTGIEGMMTAPAAPVVVAEFEGGTVMSNEVVEPYNERIANLAFGFNDTATDTAAILQEVLTTLACDHVLYAKAESLGLTAMTDDDVAAIKANAQAIYDEQAAFYAAAIDTTGMDADAAAAAVSDYLASIGITVESLEAQETETFWIQKLYDYVGSDITVTDDEIAAGYANLLSSQQSLFESDHAEYEYAIMSDQLIVYNPTGYRAVKQIMLGFTNPDDMEMAADLTEEILMLDPTNDAEKIAELQGQLDALYVDLDARAESIIAEYTAGASFESLIEKYNEDEGMNTEPVKSQGYPVAGGSELYSPEFTEAAMVMEQPGQVSTVVHTVSGVHILYYYGDIESGAVPQETVREGIVSEIRAQKQQAAYEAQVAVWVEEANIKYYPERMQ
ncbi:MAG: peptidylprolyl isomerase [Clostridia bacterium]|nr:peptidylprolyl isomerase [Clostridia bacterium]